MKLIMENWREFVHGQNNGEYITEGEKLADELIASYEEEPLNEELITGMLAVKFLVPLFLKLMAGSALSAAVAKFGNWVHKKAYGTKSDFLGQASEIFEQATRFMATVGITKAGNKIVNWYFNRKCNRNPQGKIVCSSKLRRERRKWLERIKVTETIITLAVLVTASINELAAAAKEAGGVGEALTKFFHDAGIQSVRARSATVDALSAAFDAGDVASRAGEAGTQVSGMAGAGAEASFKKDLFWKAIKSQIRTLWTGTR